ATTEISTLSLHGRSSDLSPALLVQDAAVGLASLEVSLVAAYDRPEFAGRLNLRPVLNPAVSLLDSVLCRQLEITHSATFPDEEGVMLELRICLFARLAGDRPILYGPYVWFAVPTGQVFAVEELFLVGSSGEGEDGENEDRREEFHERRWGNCDWRLRPGSGKRCITFSL